MAETSDHYTATLQEARMPYHPIINTIANVVTAVCAVAIALKVY
jgi:hypothetical protein